MLPPSVKRQPNIERMIRNLKKHNDKIVALIERYCKKKLVFARPLLPFGTIKEATAQIAHLVFPSPHAEMKNQKACPVFLSGSYFLPTLGQN